MAGRKRSAPADDVHVRSSPRITRATAGRQSAPSRSISRRTTAGRDAAVPDVYREMLIEARSALASQETGVSERPLKRKRPGEGRVRSDAPKEDSLLFAKRGDQKHGQAISDDSAEDEDLEFEDVLPAPTVQTIVKESDDEDDDEDDIAFEDVEIEPGMSSAAAAGEHPTELSLDLSAHMAGMTPRRGADRRKALSKEEKERRVEIHKMHLLCLLAHVELRNRWCNDPSVQDTLRPLLPQKTVAALIPRASLNQFGRTESLKKGLQEARDIFRLKFAITERGLRRALWAEEEEQLQNYQLPDDIESTLEKSDFIETAQTLKGSRDVGAQLFCALLRSVGVEARLVCSLQPLPCVPGAPPMPKQRGPQAPKPQPSKAELYAAAVAEHDARFPESQASATTPPPRRRLGHPHATAYHVPSMSASSSSSSKPPVPTRKEIRGESPFPVYWVEVLDVAHQKWHPVDPLVTNTQWKPRALEPPASDRQNCMTYVVAFEADGSARDVTRRYAKAYNAKTRKMRIDGAPAPPPPPPSTTTTPSGNHDNPAPKKLIIPGDRWWRRALRRYARPRPTDLDQIEANELAAAEAREPMPRNVADFKDHPVYALARHLRRHEVLAPGARPIGTVSVAGAGAGAGGARRRSGGAAPSPVERIYRRGDVRVARSREGWYRLGRVVREGEEPVKAVPRRRRRGGRDRNAGFGKGLDGDGEGSEDDDDPDKVGLFGDAAPTAGTTPLYMLEQTEEYVAPPVVDGRVPKNRFGNLDVYVPSMVPPGGVHVRHERAAQAAFILGVDYAPALTGFEFRGRQGTAVLHGAVVPAEAGEAVWAVIRGLEDVEAEEERERRASRALRMWSRFLKALRIRERIWAGVDEAEGEEVEEVEGKWKEKVAGGEDVAMDELSDDDGRGGGFFVPDEDEDGGGGGFLVE
ncbi:hypothetical protein VTK56DRAFT_9076 [Thermocarpiscus australiensis]